MSSNLQIRFVLGLFIFQYTVTSFCGSFGPMATTMPQLGGVTALSKTQILDRFAGKKTITAADKYATPHGVSMGLNRGFSSFVKHQTTVNHPSGAELFPDDAQLGSLLAAFLQSLEKDSYFLVFFSKIHLTILHQLYSYLTKVYATLAMTHVDDIRTYITTERTAELTKKTLIITHLINIIEAQSNQAIRARFPTLPKNLATYAGTVMMKHDYGSNLSLMLEKSELQFITSAEGQAMVRDVRSSYLNLYGMYLKFFNAYTNTLQTFSSPSGFIATNLFVQHAQRIQTIINTILPSINSCADVALMRSLKKINPPIFFYDEETMRGLKIIPLLATQIPAHTQSTGWPAQPLKDAQNKVEATTIYGNPLGYQRAFFADNGKKLFINIPLSQSSATSPKLYAQELIVQPEWLNSSAGVMLILRACLGDFNALLDPLLANDYILDPCLECITRNAASQVKLAIHDSSACAACSIFMQTLTDTIRKQEETITLPAGPDTMPPPPGP